MDWIFNLQIPKSQAGALIIRPSGRTFINGVAEEYDIDCYDEELLNGQVSEVDFRYVVGSLNLTLKQFWPCDFAVYLGYILAPFCFGLSLLLPYICIKDAKVGLLETLQRMNILKLKDKGLKLVYHQSCSTSWFELLVVEPKEKQLADVVELQVEEIEMV